MIEHRQNLGHASSDLTPSPLVSYEVSGTTSERIGRYGLSVDVRAAYVERATAALHRLHTAYGDGRLPMLSQTAEQDDLLRARAALDRLSAGARTIIFLGCGSVSIAAEALAQIAGWNIPGTADPAQKKRPRTRFYDNLDPLTLQGMLSSRELAATRFVFSTSHENDPLLLAQAMIVIGAAEKAGLAQNLPDMMLGICPGIDPASSTSLRTLLASRSIPTLDLPQGINGAFSILSSAALLPAMARGLDGTALRKAAGDALETALSAPQEFAATASTSFALTAEHDLRTHVIMPFSDRLEKLAAWSTGIWSQTVCHKCSVPMPIAALGPRDCDSLLPYLQHSEHAHLTTLWQAETAASGNHIDPSMAAQSGASLMAGRTVGDLVAKECQAMADALVTAGQPTRIVHIAKFDETCIGALIMHAMLEALLFAELADGQSFVS